MCNAVLGHHAADEQLAHAPFIENLRQIGWHKAVGKLLYDNGRLRRCRHNLSMYFGSFCPLVEEWGNSHVGIGDVPNVDNLHALLLRMANRAFDVSEGCVRVPEWEKPTGEVVVLKVDDQKCFLHRVSVFDER